MLERPILASIGRVPISVWHPAEQGIDAIAPDDSADIRNMIIGTSGGAVVDNYYELRMFFFKNGTSGCCCSQLLFRRSTGNDVSGLQF